MWLSMRGKDCHLIQLEVWYPSTKLPLYQVSQGRVLADAGIIGAASPAGVDIGEGTPVVMTACIMTE